METLHELLQIVTCLIMIGCTGIWFYIWNINYKSYLQLIKRIEKLEFQLMILERRI